MFLTNDVSSWLQLQIFHSLESIQPLSWKLFPILSLLKYLDQKCKSLAAAYNFVADRNEIK